MYGIVDSQDRRMLCKAVLCRVVRYIMVLWYATLTVGIHE